MARLVERCVCGGEVKGCVFALRGALGAPRSPKRRSFEHPPGSGLNARLSTVFLHLGPHFGVAVESGEGGGTRLGRARPDRVATPGISPNAKPGARSTNTWSESEPEERCA